MISESEAIERLYSYAAYVPEPGGVLDAVFACQTCKDEHEPGIVVTKDDDPRESRAWHEACPKCGGTGREQEWECRLDWGTRVYSTIEPVECMVRGPEGHRGCGWVSVIRWGGQR